MDKVIDILVQGGLSSIALVSLYFNYKIVSNHINHNTDALKDLTQILGRIEQVLEDKLFIKK